MSKTISLIFVQLAVVVLPMMGIQVGSAELTSMMQTIIVIVSGLWIWFERVQRGDVGIFGKRITHYQD